jgi:streptogramin lyase
MPLRNVVLAAVLLASAAPDFLAGQQAGPSSATWLSLLPDGLEKRKFILDCTGCHQFDGDIALIDGRVRTEPEWAASVTKMLGFAGATTGFPVIAADRDAQATAAWLAKYVRERPASPPAARVTLGAADVREYRMPEPGDLPHDVAVEPTGTVLITGMFTHVLYRLAPATGSMNTIAIPVPKANPRAIELDARGRAWVVLGGPKQLAVLEPDSSWTTFDVGMYAHSVAIGRDRAWVNGHFTHAPELLRGVDLATGTVETVTVPEHPTLGKGPGGPIPYEIRLAPDGRLWGGELQGNRLVAYSPSSGTFATFTLPTSASGPRRFDIDRAGIVWIPAYSANLIVRLDPASGQFREIPMPPCGSGRQRPTHCSATTRRPTDSPSIPCRRTGHWCGTWSSTPCAATSGSPTGSRRGRRQGWRG